MSIAAQNPFRAIAFKVASVLSFVVMASLVKAASAEVPPGEAVFFRSFLQSLSSSSGWPRAANYGPAGWRRTRKRTSFAA